MFGSNSHVTRFARDYKHASEEILAWASGSIGRPGFAGMLRDELEERERRGALIVTNRRVVFYMKRMLREVMEEVPIERIRSIDQKSYVVFSQLVIRGEDSVLAFNAWGTSKLDEVHDRIKALLQPTPS
jgi:hypothetical protein